MKFLTKIFILFSTWLYKLLQACGLHNQVITYKFACFTSFANESYSYLSILASNPTYGSVTKIKIIFQNINPCQIAT